jgi:hypothetical protein
MDTLPEKIMRNWTNEQWDAAERIEKAATAMLGEDLYGDVAATGLVTLVIEEQKRDPDTTLENVLYLAIVLGVESLFQLRHESQSPKKTAREATPRMTAKTPRVRGVRVVGVPGNRHGQAGVSIREA